MGSTFIKFLKLFISKPPSFHFTTSLILRIILLIWSIYQDRNFSVKFTDVDYHVFNGAAEAVSEGKSPYYRHTYRYTPLLAFILLPGVKLGIEAYFGKILFIISDLLVGFLNLKICELVKSRNPGYLSSISSLNVNANPLYLLWLYNPITIAVSVRGNAESLIALPILISIYLLEKTNNKKCKVVDYDYISLLLSAFLIATAIHIKIYPIIYALAFWLSFGQSNLLSFKTIFYSVICITTLIGWNLLFYNIYGSEYLEHSLFYHFKRTDIKHNFSLLFLPMYLADQDSLVSQILSKGGFFAQAVLIFFCSVRLNINNLCSSILGHTGTVTSTKAPSFSRPNLGYTCFIVTFIFVTFNKVSTSQYFLWYLALLPTAAVEIDPREGKRFAFLGLLWLLGQGIWLKFAYHLEFERKNCFIELLLAGSLFMLINGFIISKFLSCRSPLELNKKLV